MLFDCQLDGTKIVSFELCDFRPMFQHFEAEKAKKKSLSAAEKKEIKKARDEMEGQVYNLPIGWTQRESGQLPCRASWSIQGAVVSILRREL